MLMEFVDFSAFTVLAGSLLHKQLDTGVTGVANVPDRSVRVKACEDCIALMKGMPEPCASSQECINTAERIMSALPNTSKGNIDFQGGMGRWL